MPTSATHTSAFPKKVGKYRLLLPLGTGGMATVYLGRASGVGGFQRDVAVKLIHAHLRADEESRVQLLEEAKLAARIRHPNVVPVSEVGDDPSGIFLVMDYVEGDTLAGLVRRSEGGRLSRRLAARIINDALLGLQAAHDLRGVDGRPLHLVHRDFSPQNILLSVEGVTRLADFGVAKVADRAAKTKTGLTKGKISYMSPEQARGHAVDRRCDVWAAGVVAWELIAGRRMHQTNDDVATLLALVTEQPPRLASVADVSQALDAVIAKALTPELTDRYPDADTFRLALARVWAEEEGMATLQEVAEHVRRVAGPELSRRSDIIEAALSADSQVNSADPVTAWPAPELATLLSVPSHTGPPAAEPTVKLQVRPRPAPQPVSLPAEEPTQTSAVVPALPPPPKQSNTRLVISAAATLALLLVGALWAGSSNRSANNNNAPGPSEEKDKSSAAVASQPTTTASSTQSPAARASKPDPASSSDAPNTMAKTGNKEKGTLARKPTRAPRPKAKAKRRRPTPPPEQKNSSSGRRGKPGLARTPYDAPNSAP